MGEGEGGIFARKQRAFEALGVPRETKLSLSLSLFVSLSLKRKKILKEKISRIGSTVKNDRVPGQCIVNHARDPRKER